MQRLTTGCACSFYDKDAPIYTMSRFLPPSKVQDAEIVDSILGEGCVIRAGASVKHSVVGLRTLVCEHCVVEDALLMGADYYETLEECALIPGCLPMGLGAHPWCQCGLRGWMKMHLVCVSVRRKGGKKREVCPADCCLVGVEEGLRLGLAAAGSLFDLPVGEMISSQAEIAAPSIPAHLPQI